MPEIRKISVVVEFEFAGPVWDTTNKPYSIEVETTDNKNDRWFEYYPIIPGEIEYRLREKMDKKQWGRIKGYKVLSIFQG